MVNIIVLYMYRYKAPASSIIYNIYNIIYMNIFIDIWYVILELGTLQQLY